MFVYILRRVAVGWLTLLAASLIVFVSVTSANGDPRDRLATCVGCDQSAYDEEVERFGLDDPFYQQYFGWVERLTTGDLEPASSQGGRPVIEVAANKLTNTMWLVVPAWLIANSLSLYLAIRSSTKRRSAAQLVGSAVGLWGLAIPGFLTAVLLQAMVVMVADRWGFKPFRSQGLRAGSVSELLSSIVLPVTTFVLVLIARRYALLRAAVESAMQKPHIEAAIARGIPRRRILTRHLPRLIAGPFLAGTLSEVSILAGGTVVVETVFAWPGMGQLLVSSLRDTDTELSLFLAIFPVVIVLVAGIFIDALQALIDPRVREWRRW